jgi:FAD/FMN-containing dehydrogenase
LYNGMIDKRPRLIARCVDVADVITAVNFGREQGLLIAVRGGGHNGPGLGSCDDGLVIDLSTMKSVRVDPSTGTVRVDPGCTSGDVDHATHPFGLAVPFGIVSTTGVAGLTLGGGTGYLTRKYGLTVDNLLEADVVLADGSFVTASTAEHADLFWALRGGGGNFGVVTSFLFQAHPVSTVYAGPIFWDATHAKAVMQTYRDYLPDAPEELGIFVGLKTVPSMDPFPSEGWGKRACAIIGIYDGPAADGEKAMAPILEAVPTRRRCNAGSSSSSSPSPATPRSSRASPSGEPDRGSPQHRRAGLVHSATGRTASTDRPAASSRRAEGRGPIRAQHARTVRSMGAGWRRASPGGTCRR